VNLRQTLENARATLGDKEIEDASLEGEILLRHVLGISRARLFAHLDDEIDSTQEAALKRALARRLKGEPTAYITGHREFYGLDFIINQNVLIPRPETELLVEKAITLAKNRQIFKIADIGTGSGAIAICLAVNLPGVTVYATDISALALEVAGKNCKKHKVVDRVILIQGDMLEPLPDSVDMLIANLPYVRASDLPAECPLRYEPPLALDGGQDGLDRIRALCLQVDKKLQGEGCLLLEIGQGQAERVRALLKKEFNSGIIEIYRDLAGIERVVSLSLTQTRIF
jgi:release factor glutamine methyltransferase